MLANSLRCGLKETLIKSFDKLRTNGKWLISFVLSLSNHDRKQLVQSSLKHPLMIVVLLVLLCTPFVTVSAANPPETKADYLALKGQSFTVNRIEKGQDAWSKAVDLKLVEITEPAQDKSGKTEQFVLRFQAALKDKTLDKTVHRFEHATTGPFTLFLEPTGSDKKYQYYQAIFNLLRKD